ncbi:hypothetical protein BJV82DRAFT_594759 [Fennellomyces sp. T-0311]|nr:hypothetical protein BJV82DRAFT_594759 [Fennellomyces sp. T-0311]
MPSAKFHHFKRKNFQGLVYCDYCEKLLWGLARQGVHCIECGYNCHDECSKMVVQCRPPRRISPDSLSVTDSEAESLSKYTSPRGSMHQDDIKKQRPTILEQHQSSDDVLRSPTFSTTSTNNLKPSPTLSSSVKAYRKSLKQHVQTTIITAVPVSAKIVSNNANGVLSPQNTAKAFARVVARSRAAFTVSQWIYDIYAWKHTLTSTSCVMAWIALCLYPSLLLVIPPALVLALYIRVGIKPTMTASQALVPRFDENSPEYYANLERTQQSMLFLIRIYDNIAYHCGHVWLSPSSYRVLGLAAFAISGLFFLMGRWIIMLIGLVILLNKTWVGSTAEVALQFILELIQTAFDVIQKLASTTKTSTIALKPVEVSLYENQRWWAGSGYTSQLLRSERAGWSNLTGSEPLPGKDEMPPPPAYDWGESGWELDITGPWTDEQLGIVVGYLALPIFMVPWKH